jgi:hypothetical protein
MPNWCYNFATILCPSREVYDKLLKSILENNWFETFAPLGLENDNDWDYEKAIEVWKTKWGPSNIDILNQYDDEFMLEISFETAWSPPLGVYDIMNKTLGVNTTAFYSEEGWAFFGKCIYSKEEESEENYEFPFNKLELEKLRKVIGNDLDDFMLSTWDLLQEQWEQRTDEEDEEDETNEENDDEIQIWEW